MRKLAIATLALAALFLCGVPAAANATTGAATSNATTGAVTPVASASATTLRPADWVWYLYETDITLDQCNAYGQYLTSTGQTPEYACDDGDNGQEDGLEALWIWVWE